MRFLIHSYIIFVFIVFCSLLSNNFVYAQAYEGYTLYSPLNSRWAYLIDMNNAVVNSWYHTRSGGYSSSYLMPDSSLFRDARSSNSPLNGGGATGIIQKSDWDGNLLWEYTYSSNTYRSHHDHEVLPNGNVLLIAWEVKTASQCIQAGLNHSDILWPDHIIEVQPVGTNGGVIVWEWHFWDHLIQDHDPTKDNYGVVGDHPELLDINQGSSGSGDWTHINGISYNPTLDQIVISSHTLDEIYVIDHSTTTEEAASHLGGNSGMGGDILYRWGRPSNYDRPGSQVFNVVHSSVWIPDNLPGGGHIMAYNNREGQGSSQIVEIAPPYFNTYNYYIEPGQPFGPTSAYWNFTANWFYSNHLGGCQRLPNGNTLIAESTSGYLFEVDSIGNVVWDYNAGGQIARALRYPLDYLNGTTTFQLSVNVTNGWNMVSVPGINPDGMGVNTWWSNLTGSVFGFYGGYEPVTATATGEGYWMKNSGAETYNYPAIEIVVHDPIPAFTGWNMIGGYENSAAVSGLTTNPPGLISGSVFGYSGGYVPATNLVPGYGYWIKLTGDGDIIIPGGPLAKGSVELLEYIQDDWGKITITDNAGRSYPLYAVNGEVNLDNYELPPMPPSGMFDIRFGSGRIAEDLSKIQTILFQGVEYPINIKVENLSIILRDLSSKDIIAELEPGEEFLVNSKISDLLVESADLTNSFKFELNQNYPNPFNPLTEIKFQIPEQSYVQIKVYDILGNEIASMVNEILNAGYHSIEFNAEKFSSGIYFYSLITEKHNQTKKMILIK